MTYYCADLFPHVLKLRFISLHDAVKRGYDSMIDCSVTYYDSCSVVCSTLAHH